MKHFLKRTMTALLLAGMLLCQPVAAAAAFDAPAEAAVSASAKTPDLSPEAVYAAMIAFKDTYPEGTPYTNDDYYKWNGGIYAGGYGCAGFAFMLSDAAFGNLPARKFTDYTQLRVGDLLRVNNDTHFVVVMEIYENYIVLAEGNYNYSVHWGRKMPMSEVFASSTVYGITRYPENWHPAPQAGDLNGDGELTTSDAVLLLRVIAEDASTALPDAALLDAADFDGDGMLTARDSSQLLASLM